MRTWATMLVLGFTILAGGCGGATTSNPPAASADMTLTDPETITLEQGGSATVSVQITKKEFDSDVSVFVKNLPEGVTLKEKDPKIAKGSNSIDVTLEAKADAAPVEKHKAELSVTASGVTKKKDLEVTVTKK